MGSFFSRKKRPNKRYPKAIFWAFWMEQGGPNQPKVAEIQRAAPKHSAKMKAYRSVLIVIKGGIADTKIRHFRIAASGEVEKEASCD